MNYNLIAILFFFVFASCIGKNSVAIKSKSPKATTTTSSSAITVASVKVLNNQIVLTGTNLSSATSLVIKEGSTTTTLTIESQTSSSLIANTLAGVTLAAGKIFEFVVSSANASATFTVDFSLCSSSLGGKAFDCTTTPNDKEVLSYDANSGKWKPRSVNGLSYQGVWDASSSLPTATTEGDYFIVSVASGSYAVGDWIVYNGSSFEKVSNSNTVTSVFGRTGAVTGVEADYILGKMGDVDFTTATPTTNQVLKFNGTNWVGATLSTVESDPNVMAFAKTTLPTCGSSEVLKGNGTSLSCVTVSSSGSSFSGTASRTVVTDGSGALAVSAVTSTELGYVSGVTSAIQTQINAFQTYAKTPIPTCGAGEVLKSNGTTFSCVTDNTGSGSFSGTASRAIVSDGSGALAVSAVTSTELGYVSGVTSAIQTQLGNKQDTISATTDLTANSITTDSQSAVVLNPYNTGAGQTGEIRFYELAASGTNYVGIKSPDTLSANYTMTLPTTPGTPGQVLSATGSGVLGWIDNSLGNLALTSGNIIVGSAGNVASSVTMSGDATMANTGALTIAADSVALSTDTTGNYVTNITASNGLQATAAAGEGTTPNLVLGGALTGATTLTQGTHNFLFDLTSTGVFSVLAGANGLSVSNLGVTTLTSAVLTTADINGGTLDDVTIGATTRAPGSFTTISATSAAIVGTVSAGTLLTSNILGGTTTTSSLTLKTTSGVGTTTADMHFLVGNNGATEALTILNNGFIGIGNTTPVALLDLTSTTTGFLPPRMDSTQRDAIASPATGLTIYNTTTGFIEVYNGSAWVYAGQSIPTGAIMAFESASCPTGWTEYTTARGRFLRGIDSTGTNDPDGVRAAGSTQTDAFQGHWHTTHRSSGYTAGGTFLVGDGASNGSVLGAAHDPETDTVNGVPRTAAETRPKNVAVLYCQYSGGNGASLPTGANQIGTGNSTITVTDSGANGTIAFTTEGSERMRIDATGNVGIGNTSPVVALDVTGGVRAGNSTTVTSCGLGSANGEGTQRYNYTTHSMEYCDGTSWVSAGGKAAAKAWVNFNGASCPGSVCAIRASYNVTSVTRITDGQYRVTMTSAMTDVNYVTSIAASGVYNGSIITIAGTGDGGGIPNTTTEFTFSVRGGIGSAGGSYDALYVHAIVLGN